MLRERREDALAIALLSALPRDATDGMNRAVRKATLANEQGIGPEAARDEPEAAVMARSEEGVTSVPDADEMMDGEAMDESMKESVDAIGSLKIIRCKKADRGIPCMKQCANAGISCAAKRPHPEDHDVGYGELGQCRTLGAVGSCWYHYPNGQLCVFVPWRSFCRIDND
ncbi:hypothetical protein ACSRUE_43670 [Sorangium sp. KYC3313]|uniref:hypothetical protein n=1 Tax=Sorangium sp. KYC3313 TaxID=3449740 RepID=UPI003F89C3EA